MTYPEMEAALKAQIGDPGMLNILPYEIEVALNAAQLQVGNRLINVARSLFSKTKTYSTSTAAFQTLPADYLESILVLYDSAGSTDLRQATMLPISKVNQRKTNPYYIPRQSEPIAWIIGNSIYYEPVPTAGTNNLQLWYIRKPIWMNREKKRTMTTVAGGSTTTLKVTDGVVANYSTDFWANSIAAFDTAASTTPELLGQRKTVLSFTPAATSTFTFDAADPFGVAVPAGCQVRIEDTSIIPEQFHELIVKGAEAQIRRKLGQATEILENRLDQMFKEIAAGFGENPEVRMPGQIIPPQRVQ
jgi:hypothetical protein